MAPRGAVLGVALVAAILLSLDVYGTAGAALHYGGSHVVSGLTCTGLQTETDLGHRWPASGHLVVTGTMLVGGAVGSTVGGIKLLRVRRLPPEVPGRGSEIYDPDETSTETASGTSAEFDTAASIALLWIVALLGTVLVATLVPPMESTQYTLSNVLVEVASVQGNVGLSAGVVAPTMPDALKAAFVVSMWAGRLEFIPVVVTAKPIARELCG